MFTFLENKNTFKNKIFFSGKPANVLIKSLKIFVQKSMIIIKIQ